MWYELNAKLECNTDRLEAELRVPADSAWFDGHFPDAPVLPGIAQLAAVYELIDSAFPDTISVSELSRVRFKQIILPEERLEVAAEPKRGKKNVYAFRITKGGELACSGTMRVAFGMNAA